LCERCREIEERLQEIAGRLDYLEDWVLHAKESTKVALDGGASAYEAGGEPSEVADILWELEEIERSYILSFAHLRQVAALKERGFYILRLLKHLTYSAKLLSLQERLRNSVSQEAWDIYLNIEELINEVTARLLN